MGQSKGSIMRPIRYKNEAYRGCAERMDSFMWKHILKIKQEAARKKLKFTEY